MRVNRIRVVLAVVLLATTSAFAATWRVGIGDDCDAGVPIPCFSPASLTIGAGDTVEFFIYADTIPTGPANVVADDGSFRCAMGCDGEGGDGTPRGYTSQWDFTRTFNAAGVVRYHDEVSGTAGAIVVRDQPVFSVTPAITGSWFNPAQNGQGFMLEVLPGTSPPGAPLQLLASWLVFAPPGGQSWIYGIGSVVDNQVVIRGMQGLGGRFPPNFDAATVSEQYWGTLTFSFSDCNHGHVEWVSSAPGYGSGGMDLVRLTQPAGLTCP